MEDIIIAVLKSDNVLKLKNALVDKLITNYNFLDTQNGLRLNLNNFLKEIEKLWLIDELSLIASFNMDIKQTNDQLKHKYESLKLHYELLKKILKYYNSNLDMIDFDQQDIEFHYKNLFKSIFLTNLNRPNFNILVIKNTSILLIKWLCLIIESFSNRIEFKINMIEILNLINSKFNSKQTEIINYHYFIQNDYKFCSEYLKLIKSFDFIDLIQNISSQTQYEANSNIGIKIDYIENNQSETVCLIFNSICFKQNLNDQEQQMLINQYELYNQDTTLLIKEFLNNLNEIVILIQSFLSKSTRLFEWSLKYLFDILSDYAANENQNGPTLNTLNPHTAELFKCFDINLAQLTIDNYFYEATLSNASLDETSLKNLLYSLIVLLSWPFENNIDQWICLLMTILATKLQKFKLLVNVCKETIDYILRLTQNRSTRVSSINVLCFFIINYQHSPTLFHKSCPRIVELLLELKPNNYNEKNDIQRTIDSKCYYQLAQLSFLSISNFGGYPEIYKPILDIIQNDVDLSNLESFKSMYLIDRNNLKNFKTTPTIEKMKLSSETEIVIDDDSIDLENLGKFRPNMSGLINLGNTCYLNCIIQSLFSCKNFTKKILEIDTNNMKIDEKSFLVQLQILFSIMNFTHRPAIKASNFVKYCTPSWFKFGQQQDSSEFLIFLLDNLNEQLKNFKNNHLYSKYYNLIQNTFGIHLTTECECTNCHTKTARTDISFYLPLSFENHHTNSNNNISNENKKQNDKIQSLQNLVDKFFLTEQLSVQNGNPYSCSKCQSLQTANKRMLFTQDDEKQAPDYLIFTLNRFIYKQSNEGLQNVKIMEQLDYPSQIDLKSIKNGHDVIEKYKIVSIVVHSGSSLHYGHYYSYLVNKKTDTSQSEIDDNKIEWLLANDSQISHASFDSLKSNLNLFKNDTPYVIFCKRVKENTFENDSTIDINSINKKMIDIIEQDNNLFELEEKNRLIRKKQNEKKNTLNNSNLNDKFSNYFKDDDDDSKSSGQPPSYCANDSERDSGPRIIF